MTLYCDVELVTTLVCAIIFLACQLRLEAASISLRNDILSLPIEQAKAKNYI